MFDCNNDCWSYHVTYIRYTSDINKVGLHGPLSFVVVRLPETQLTVLVRLFPLENSVYIIPIATA